MTFEEKYKKVYDDVFMRFANLYEQERNLKESLKEIRSQQQQLVEPIETYFKDRNMRWFIWKNYRFDLLNEPQKRKKFPQKKQYMDWLNSNYDYIEHTIKHKPNLTPEEMYDLFIERAYITEQIQRKRTFKIKRETPEETTTDKIKERFIEFSTTSSPSPLLLSSSATNLSTSLATPTSTNKRNRAH